MKFKKYIFTLLITSILCILSIITINNYDALKDKQYDFNRFISNNGYDLQLYLFDIIEQNDPTYQFIQIDEKDELETEAPYIYNQLGNKIHYFSSETQDDPNLQIIIRKDNKYIYNPFDLNITYLDKDYHHFYSYIRFDENGVIEKCESDLCSYFKNNSLDDYINANITEDGKDYFNYDWDFYINVDKVTFHNPKNTEIYVLIPYKIIPTGYVYLESTQYVEPYILFIVIFALLAFVILSIVIFFAPIKEIEMRNPFKTIKNWLIELNILIFGSTIPFLGFLAILLCKCTLEGTFEYLLKENYSQSVFMFINFIAWTLFYFFLAIIPFLIKYIFTYGFFNYIKDYTILGRSWLKLKNEISNIQVGYKVIILTILAFVIPAAIGLFSIYLFAGGGWILVGIGYIALFILVLMIENKIYIQYKTLLDKTHQLSEGNFDIEINENLGLFEDYKKELLHVKDGFEKAVQEEVKSTNMKTELITNVSHDLKTPITCIKNYVTLLENEDLDKETQKEYIHNLHQYTNRLTHLVEDLFEVSKVNSGNISLELVELNIVDLVKQVLTENNDIFENSNLTVVSKFEHDHISCVLDSDKTYRIFENLITNIGKYALPHTRVYVDVCKVNDYVQITFKNISKDEMNFTSEEIVERFVRGDSSRHEQGSGIGLAIVKSYTEIQNGTFNISVDGDLFKAILTFKESLISK